MSTSVAITQNGKTLPSKSMQGKGPGLGEVEFRMIRIDKNTLFLGQGTVAPQGRK